MKTNPVCEAADKKDRGSGGQQKSHSDIHIYDNILQWHVKI